MSESLALTRTSGGPIKPVPEVPAFLNKLYTMVDDPATDDIITWSDDGESFYILSQDELGKQVLGNWFKHNKFSSFVRQLNMYGFHKMQQMKQGALKNGAEDEIWQFQEPNFRRGRLDLLKSISRKKGAGGAAATAARANDADTAMEFIADGDASAPAASSSGAGPIALHSLADQLTVIKRTQSSLLNDLKALQVSNGQLWKETLASQTTQKKQQDTIDRIVKFLAGVFGSSGMRASTPHDVRSDDGRGTTQTPSPRVAGRPLLLEDGNTVRRKSQRSTDLVRRQTNPTEQLDAHRFSEAITPVERSPTETAHFEEIRGSESPEAGPSNLSKSTAISRRSTPRPPVNYTRSPLPTQTELPGMNGSSSDVQPNPDFSAMTPSFAELLSTSPNLLFAALAQMQNQQNSLNLDSMSVGMPMNDTNTNTRYNNDQHGNNLANSNDLTSQSLPTFTYPSPPTDHAYLPTSSSPRFTYSDPNHIAADGHTGTSDAGALFFPYGIDPALPATAQGIDQTYTAAQQTQNNIDQTQQSIDNIMRELLRLNPNAYMSVDPNNTNMVNGTAYPGARVEDLGDDGAMLDGIGLPSVDSAVANAQAAAAGGAGNLLNGVSPNDTVDVTSFFNHFTGTGNEETNNQTSSSVQQPQMFDASQYLNTTPELASATAQPLPPPPAATATSQTQSQQIYRPPLNTDPPQPQPQPQPEVTTTTLRTSGRPKRKSDAGNTMYQGQGVLNPGRAAKSVVKSIIDVGTDSDDEPPAKKLRSRRKQK